MFSFILRWKIWLHEEKNSRKNKKFKHAHRKLDTYLWMNMYLQILENYKDCIWHDIFTIFLSLQLIKFSWFQRAISNFIAKWPSITDNTYCIFSRFCQNHIATYTPRGKTIWLVSRTARPTGGVCTHTYVCIIFQNKFKFWNKQ